MITAGNRLKLSGGYANPGWLCGRDFYLGRAVAFLPEETKRYLIVELDQEITVSGLTGAFLLLSLRHERASWNDSEIVHVVLCKRRPPFDNWKSSSDTEWVEGAACYERIPQDTLKELTPRQRGQNS